MHILSPLYNERSSGHDKTPAWMARPCPKGLENLTLQLLDENSPGRELAEQFAHSEYMKAFSADLQTFAKELMVLRSSHGKIHSCVGISENTGAPFFLEHYFEGPIEEIISVKTGSHVKRDSIVEISSLATKSSGVAVLMMAGLVGYLFARGKKYLTFTATKTLRNTLLHLSIPLNLIACAREECLPSDNRTNWGRYYEAEPEVLWVDMRLCLSAVQRLLKLRYKIESHGRMKGYSGFVKGYPYCDYPLTARDARIYPGTALKKMFIKGAALRIEPEA